MALDTVVRGTTGLQAEVKAASTAPVALDQALVVNMHPTQSVLAGALCKAEDAVHASGDVGVMALGVRTDTPASLGSATGDYTPLAVGALGQQWTTNISTPAGVGYAVSKIISAATTNATIAKASAGQVYAWSFTNIHATSWRYVKLYNKATAPVPGTDVPVITVGIPPASTVEKTFESGVIFATGIGFSVVGGIADLDATAVGAAEVAVNLFYK
jgi:hypothetical protein